MSDTRDPDDHEATDDEVEPAPEPDAEPAGHCADPPEDTPA